MSKIKETLKNIASKAQSFVEAPVMPEGATGIEKLKLSNFILETERITKEAKELNDRLTLKIKDKKTCKIIFDGDTGVPRIELADWSNYLYSSIKLEFDEIRDVLVWLKDRGIKC